MTWIAPFYAGPRELRAKTAGGGIIVRDIRFRAYLSAGDGKAHCTTSMNAGDILTLLRHLDIPCSIDSFAAMGWTAKLGDPAKGFYAQQSRFPTLDAAASWLIEEARRQYPDAMPVREESRNA